MTLECDITEEKIIIIIINAEHGQPQNSQKSFFWAPGKVCLNKIYLSKPLP